MVSDIALCLQILKIQGGGGAPNRRPPLNTPLLRTDLIVLQLTLFFGHPIRIYNWKYEKKDRITIISIENIKDL